MKHHGPHGNPGKAIGTIYTRCIFGSDKSNRRGNLVCACVRPYRKFQRNPKGPRGFQEDLKRMSLKELSTPHRTHRTEIAQRKQRTILTFRV